MDKLDSEIMDKLMHDSRVSFRKIAKELGVSTDTVMRRFNKLKKDGTIKPTLLVNIFKIGYEASVWYMISLRPQVNISSAVDDISKIADVTMIIKAVGDYDLLVIAPAKGFKHMYKIGDELAKVSGVTKIEARPYIPRNKAKGRYSMPRGFYRHKD